MKAIANNKVLKLATRQWLMAFICLKDDLSNYLIKNLFIVFDEQIIDIKIGTSSIYKCVSIPFNLN